MKDCYVLQNHVCTLWQSQAEGAWWLFIIANWLSWIIRACMYVMHTWCLTQCSLLCERFFSSLSLYPLGYFFVVLCWNSFKRITVTSLLSRLFELIMLKSIAATREVGLGGAEACSTYWNLLVQYRRMTSWLSKSKCSACLSKNNYPLDTKPLSWLGNIVKLNSFWVCVNRDCFNTAHGIFCSLLRLSQTTWRGSFNRIALISLTF